MEHHEEESNIKGAAGVGPSSQSLATSLVVKLVSRFYHWILAMITVLLSHPPTMDNKIETEEIREQEDYCSGYCSGSCPSSPTPSSNQEGGEEQEETSDKFPERSPPASKMVKRVDSTSSSSDEQEDNLELGGGRRDSGFISGGDDPEIIAEEEEQETTPETASRIITQVESLFSDEHLAKDGFLLKHVRRRSDGFVSLKLVAGLRKVKQISRDFNVVLDAVKVSDKLEVNSEGTKIRRRDPLTSELKGLPIKQQKKDKRPNKEGGEQQQPTHTTPTDAINKKPVTASSHQKDGTDSFLQNRMMRRREPLRALPQNQTKQSSINKSSHQQFHVKFAQNNQVQNQKGGQKSERSQRSQSYSEGTDVLTASSTSSWLQKRRASAFTSRLSVGDISLTAVIRQPRGPDGTKGFQPGYRNMIMQERLLTVS